MSEQLVKKLIKKFVIRCDKCRKIGTMYCGECGGAQCEKCFKEHLDDCRYCLEDT